MVTVTAQATPNPNAYKFTLMGHTFDGPVSLQDASSARGTPFEALFALSGVASVFATSNFVTVTKQPGSNWGGLAEEISKALEKAFTSA